MIQSCVCKDVKFHFCDNLPNALRCSTVILHKWLPLREALRKERRIIIWCIPKPVFFLPFLLFFNSHRENRHTTRLGKPGTPAVQERQLGEARQLEADSMPHHGSKTYLDAHPQTGGPGSIPRCTANDVGSHTG